MDLGIEAEMLLWVSLQKSHDLLLKSDEELLRRSFSLVIDPILRKPHIVGQWIKEHDVLDVITKKSKSTPRWIPRKLPTSRPIDVASRCKCRVKIAQVLRNSLH